MARHVLPALSILAAIGLLAAQGAATARATEEADAVAALNAKGIRKGNSLYLAGETELKKKLGEEIKLKKALQAANATLDEATQATDANEQAIRNLEAQLIIANQAGNAQANNAIIGELKLRERQEKDLEKAESEARAKAHEAREEYVAFLVDSRKLADQLDEQYKSLPEDAEVKSAIEDLNKATSKTWTLGPTGGLKSSLAQLKKYETAMTLESIPLRREDNTLWAHVAVNGKKTLEMVVDSGSSLLLLPAKTAASLNISTPADAQPVKLTLADGRSIDGKRFKLSSVRVGKFELEQVECAVIGSEFPGAEPLLGMSFLSEFIFKIDADQATLTLTKVGDQAKPGDKNKKNRKPKAKR